MQTAAENEACPGNDSFDLGECRLAQVIFDREVIRAWNGSRDSHHAQQSVARGTKRFLGRCNEVEPASLDDGNAIPDASRSGVERRGGNESLLALRRTEMEFEPLLHRRVR